MNLEIGFTEELTNTQYAPLAVLMAHFQQAGLLESLAGVEIPMRKREFSSKDKLVQILMSILAGCMTLSEVNGRLKSEGRLAWVVGCKRFADQSSLSRTLDALTLNNIDQLRESITTIGCARSQVNEHDWRNYLWLDFDLSGLPCSPCAQESQRGYFSDKKTPAGDS
jgi:hypothetical protein